MVVSPVRVVLSGAANIKLIVCLQSVGIRISGLFVGNECQFQ